MHPRPDRFVDGWVSSGAEHWKTMESEQQGDQEAVNERGEGRIHKEGKSVK